MNNKNSKHFLDETVQRAKIENAQREAEQIYNYNKWKDNHEKMVKHELRKRDNNRFNNTQITTLIPLNQGVQGSNP